ncbi:hypothetical protein BDN72DRAFT_892160 [Pluteus cervinus]|uniref:Uncharacterized protein n=1 Tax=Pluteus cervinus TaxID=181527 RepID=A0ACD3BCA6_9AGAR|nr:hypothetical protein BDN72DRAFT_892160 [Pluteus cervinus]
MAQGYNALSLGSALVKLCLIGVNTWSMYRAAVQPKYGEGDPTCEKKPLPSNRPENVFRGFCLRIIFVIPFGYLALSSLEIFWSLSHLLSPLGFGILPLVGSFPIRVGVTLLQSSDSNSTPAIPPAPLDILTPTFLVGTILTILGTSGRVACFHTLKEHFTYQLTELQNHKLITHGLYSIVRHPAYISGMTALIGAVVALCGPTAMGGAVVLTWQSSSLNSGLGAGVGHVEMDEWVVLVEILMKMMDVARMVYVVYCFLFMSLLIPRTIVEDKFLRKRFGKEWEAYASVVRYRLVPWVF